MAAPPAPGSYRTAPVNWPGWSWRRRGRAGFSAPGCHTCSFVCRMITMAARQNIPPSCIREMMPLRGDVPVRAEETPERPGLRVAYVNDIAYIVETLAPALGRRGIRSCVVGRHSGDPSLNRGSFVQNVIRIRSSLARVRDFDILHINYALYGFIAYGSKRPVILHCHGSDLRPGRKPKERISNAISKMSLRLADQVWYSTTDMGAYFAGGEVSPRYMPNPVAEPFFGTSLETAGRKHVLFAVPLTRLKGADIAVEAMRILTRDPDVSVSAFAYNPKRGDFLSLLKRIPKSVRLLPWTPHDKMPDLMSSADVVVGRLRMGSLGVTELEAMAAARPLVVCQSDPVRRLVGYYETEPPILSVDSSQSIADAVERCLEDGSFAAGLRLRGREWTRQYHSPEVVAGIYEREYRELTDGG